MAIHSLLYIFISKVNSHGYVRSLRLYKVQNYVSLDIYIKDKMDVAGTCAFIFPSPSLSICYVYS